MKQEFNKEYYENHRGCYSLEKMQGLVDANPHSTLQEFLNWPITLKDKFYFVNNYTELTIPQKQRLALMCAKVSLEIYEAKYPDDNRVANCIIGIEKFLGGLIARDALLVLRNAAYAAYAYAYANAAAAAYDAYAYAYAYAAAAAAAAAYDAYAYAYAYAADAARSSDYHTEKLLNALREWCKEQAA